MKFKQLTFFKFPSSIIESSEYGSPIRFDDWCSRELDRIPNSQVVAKYYASGGKRTYYKIAIYAEV